MVAWGGWATSYTSNWFITDAAFSKAELGGASVACGRSASETTVGGSGGGAGGDAFIATVGPLKVQLSKCNLLPVIWTDIHPLLGH